MRTVCDAISLDSPRDVRSTQKRLSCLHLGTRRATVVRKLRSSPAEKRVTGLGAGPMREHTRRAGRPARDAPHGPECHARGFAASLRLRDPANASGILVE